MIGVVFSRGLQLQIGRGHEAGGCPTGSWLGWLGSSTSRRYLRCRLWSCRCGLCCLEGGSSAWNRLEPSSSRCKDRLLPVDPTSRPYRSQSGQTPSLCGQRSVCWMLALPLFCSVLFGGPGLGSGASWRGGSFRRLGRTSLELRRMGMSG